MTTQHPRAEIYREILIQVTRRERADHAQKMMAASMDHVMDERDRLRSENETLRPVTTCTARDRVAASQDQDYGRRTRTGFGWWHTWQEYVGTAGGPAVAQRGVATWTPCPARCLSLEIPCCWTSAWADPPHVTAAGARARGRHGKSTILGLASTTAGPPTPTTAQKGQVQMMERAQKTMNWATVDRNTHGVVRTATKRAKHPRSTEPHQQTGTPVCGSPADLPSPQTRPAGCWDKTR